MRWKGRRVSTNVEDRRGGGGAKAGGISILGLVVAFVAWKFFGIDPQSAYQATKQVTSHAQSAETKGLDNPSPEQQEAMEFVGTGPGPVSPPPSPPGRAGGCGACAP